MNIPGHQRETTLPGLRAQRACHIYIRENVNPFAWIPAEGGNGRPFPAGGAVTAGFTNSPSGCCVQHGSSEQMW